MNNTRITKRLGALGAGVSLTLALHAADWPAYHGPNQNGTTSEAVHGWEPTGLKTIWKTPMLDGLSSLAVADGKVFTLVMREIEGVNQEACIALDAKSGKELWAQALGTVKINSGGESGTPDNKGGDGPRSTPSVSDGRVYSMSAKLVLSCFSAGDGKLVWRKDLVKEHGGRNINWESAQSPVIEGNLVIVAGGGQGQAFLAFNNSTGALAWKGEDDLMTHSTPVVGTILGQRQIIFFTQKGLVSVVPQTGAVLWRYMFPYATSTAISPVVCGDIVFCSAGYHNTAGAARIAKQGKEWTATELWRQNGSGKVNHWSTPVFKDGYLYGMFGFKEYGKGPVKCFEVATGKEMWSKPGFGPGNVILTGGRVLALSDTGELVLIEADPKEYKEVSRTKVVSGKCWSTPAVANGRIYVRSTREGACLEVGKPLASH